MRRSWKLVVPTAIIGASALLGAGVAQGAEGGGTDEGHEVDTPITGAALARASEAALAVTGEGRVTATEVGDEESYYEVEVTLPDGNEVDVQLDESFAYVETTD